ncbi:MAG: hypothetical protein ABSH05_05340 [Bryobacteraceae bacterium]|jgi:hypothetical protein
MRWILQGPLIFCALMALGLGACLDLFLTLKRELRSARRRQQALDAAMGQLSLEIAELRERLLESDERAATLVAPAPARSGVNLSTRSQALRMSRRGAPNQQIAAALGIPEKEVELLLKVQRIALDVPAKETPAAPEPAAHSASNST